jgi:hypothetical protein
LIARAPVYRQSRGRCVGCVAEGFKVNPLRRAARMRSQPIKAVAGQGADEGEAVNKMLGVILIALGLLGLAWGGFTYTTRKKVVDIGPIHATRDVKHYVALPPIAGGVALIGGILLLVASGKD